VRIIGVRIIGVDRGLLVCEKGTARLQTGERVYLSFYSLREYPFNVTSDPGFLYLSPTHKEALDHLRYGIEQRKGFLAITGEIGAGKTTLCRALINRLDSSVKVALILNSVLPETQLLEAIADDFGIVIRGRRTKGVLLRTINAFLLEQVSKGNNAVLIIDEAQNMRAATLETVRMLSNLETEKEKLLQIILVGQPQLRDKLNAPELVQLKQRIAVRFHVRALTLAEVGAYIRHRLKVAGAGGDLRFEDEAVDAIHAYSSGIPRLINLLADRALLEGFVQETRRIDSGTIRRCVEELEGNMMVSIKGEPA
jgi:general secretion pathway protein A